MRLAESALHGSAASPRQEGVSDAWSVPRIPRWRANQARSRSQEKRVARSGRHRPVISHLEPGSRSLEPGSSARSTSKRRRPWGDLARTMWARRVLRTAPTISTSTWTSPTGGGGGIGGTLHQTSQGAALNPRAIASARASSRVKKSPRDVARIEAIMAGRGQDVGAISSKLAIAHAMVNVNHGKGRDQMSISSSSSPPSFSLVAESSGGGGLALRAVLGTKIAIFLRFPKNPSFSTGWALLASEALDMKDRPCSRGFVKGERISARCRRLRSLRWR